MLNKIEKGLIKPCPVCGGQNIDWGGYRYPFLVCNYCGFEMYSQDEFATEKEYFKEWNKLSEIDTSIAIQDEHIEFAKRIIKECDDKKKFYISIKEKIAKGKKELTSSI